jgi:hypothetical protein
MNIYFNNDSTDYYTSLLKYESDFICKYYFLNTVEH